MASFVRFGAVPFAFISVATAALAQTPDAPPAELSGPLCTQALSAAPSVRQLPSDASSTAEARIEYHRAKALELNATQPDEAMAHACLYLETAKEAALPIRAADAERLIAGILWLRGEVTPALAWIDKSSAGYDRAGDIAKQATAANLRGAINLDAGNFRDALFDFRNALRDAERSDATEERLQALANIGIVYSDLGDHEAALSYLRRALETQESQGRTFDAAMTRLNVGRALSELDRQREAAAEFDQAVEALRQQLENTEDDSEGAVAAAALPRLLQARADNYLDLGRAANALADLNEAVELASQMGGQAATLSLTVSRARAYAALGNTSEAARLVAEAKGLGEPKNPLFALQLAMTDAEVSAAQGRFDDAYRASERAAELRDSLREAEAVRTAARTEIEMGVEDIQRQALLDEQRAENAELRVERQQRGLLAALLGIALLLGIVAALFVAARNRRIASRALENTLRMRETLLSEIHHRTKNNLQLLSSLLRLGGPEEKDRPKSSNAANRARTMALVHDHLYTDLATNSDRVDAQPFFAQLTDLLGESIGREGVELVRDIDDVAIRSDLATVLGLLACEMITNAYKHAFDAGRGEIELAFEADTGGQATLCVTDNGRGFDAAANPRRGSIGMQLIRDLADQAGGTLEVESKPGHTRFSVTGIALDTRAAAERQLAATA